VQANANFFVKRSTARMACRLLKEDRIHLLGSDCHNMVQRKPNLDLAVQRIRTSLGDDSLRRIEQHQAELLEMY
jgi:protein-tyrosine phosphatase